MATKQKWYALRDTNDIVCLGECEDFNEADEKCQTFNATWIFDTETASEWRDFLNSEFEAKGE